jgi:CRP/FNR family nitrogen fixation transcriptional regulator
MMGSIAQDLQPASGLLAAGPVRHFAANAAIYCAGDAADALLKVVCGVVRTQRFLHDGRRQIDAFYSSGALFGFERGASYTLSAEAVSGCTLVSYSHKGLAILATNNQALTRQLYNYTLDGLVRAQAHARLLAQGAAIAKLAGFLIECSELSADENLITFVMARHDIADYLGITVETVSRTLTELRKASFIELISAREIRLMNLPGLHLLNS